MRGDVGKQNISNCMTFTAFFLSVKIIHVSLMSFQHDNCVSFKMSFTQKHYLKKNER